MHKQNFTMPELLIIAVMIFLIAAVSMPLMINASAQGKAASCKDNLRKCQKAVAAYCADNAGQVVLKSHDFNHMTLLWGITSGRSPLDSSRNSKTYIGSFADIICPALNSVIPEKNSAAANSVNNFYAVPYMAMKKRGGSAISEHESLFYNLRNREAYFQLDKVAGSTVVDTLKLSDPSSAMLFAEVWSLTNKNGFYHYSFNAKNNPIDLRHNNRTNIAFFDGHVASENNIYFEDLKDNEYILSSGATGYLVNSRTGKLYTY